MNIFNSLGSNYNLGYILQSLGSGKKEDVKNLEKFLEEKYGGKTFLFYKGREALTAAVKILDLKEDSQVAINGFTCVAVFNAVRKAGMEPICIDLTNTGGLNFTAAKLEEEIKKNKKIKVVVIQNTLGYPCDIQEIEKVCKKYKLILIEDLAHCVGTKYEDGRKAGTVGNFVILSFSQDKIIDAVSGGALIDRMSHTPSPLDNTRDRQISTPIQSGSNIKTISTWDRLYPAFTYKIRKTYSVGLGKPYHFLLKRLGLMSKVMDKSFYDFYALPSWNARMVISEFKNLERQLTHRKKIANIYVESLPDSLFMFDKNKMKENVGLSSNLRFPIFIENRDEVIKKLQKSGAHLSDIWYTEVEPKCPNAVAKSKIILNLPTHINVSEKDAVKICQIINLFQTQT